MKHASLDDLVGVADLLAIIRGRALVKEKSPGVFYRKGRAWLHFHSDPQGLFADIRPDDDWIRLRMFDAADKARLVEMIGAG